MTEDRTMNPTPGRSASRLIAMLALTVMLAGHVSPVTAQTAGSESDQSTQVTPVAPADNDAVESETPSVETDAAPQNSPAVPKDERGTLDETPTQEPAVIDNATLPHDLSPWGMFIAADWVVKGVMIGLAFASLVTWTIWLAKSLEIAGARARAGKALRAIVASRTLDEANTALEKAAGPAALLVSAATHEVEASLGAPLNAPGVKERVASHLGRIEAQAARRMTRGTGMLATIGSTAPFVGLFGTVWGIMNAFIGISEAQTTNLAVVAPGIAEALLATALGLMAAIPAVVIYNLFARSIAGYKLLLGDAAAAVERLVSRDLDREAATDVSRPMAKAAE
jgi:biopolymer transport protein ExbB